MAATLRLSNGYAWQLGSCDGAVAPWVSQFSSILGLDHQAAPDTRRLLFCRVRYENALEPIRHVFPFLPREVSPEKWRRSIGHSVVFAHHPEIRDVFCGLMPATEFLSIRQMHQALLPVYDEVILSGGLPVHGASIGLGENGILLLGQSGAGKTTCCRRLPSPWSVLGDDMALAVQGLAGDWMTHPLPTWSAVRSGDVQWPCSVNRALNLKACFLLEWSKDDAVIPMSKADSVLAIHRAAIQMLRGIGHTEHGDRTAWNEKVFENAVALSKMLPVHRLRVSLKGRFWEKIEAVLDKWTVPLFPVAGESLANNKG
jgi:SynChlorMet cassette protein ScmC